MKFYKLNSDELQKELNTNLNNGLSQNEANIRINECKNNFSVNAAKDINLNNIFNKDIVFILISALIYFLAAVFKKNFAFLYFGLAILIIYAVSTTLFLIYFRYLIKKYNRSDINKYSTISVVRDCEIVNLPYNEIVYGDVVYIKKGDYIPFDGIVLESDGCLIDETNVTSIKSASKFPGVILDDNVQSSKLTNTVFCGSYVSNGSAKVVVTDIGNRVYINKTQIKHKNDIKYSSGVMAYIKLFSLVFSVIAILLSLISVFFSKSFISFMTCSCVIAAMFIFDVFSKYISIVNITSYIHLHDKDIYLKSPMVFESINNISTMLIDINAAMNDKVEISSFLYDNVLYRSISEVNKSNFSVFLYSAFCNKSSYNDNGSFEKANIKILKKLGIDYSNIESMCPIISYYNNTESGYEMAGRVYDGNNMLILRGEYNSVISMCDNVNIDVSLFEQLRLSSTNVVAVAIKKTNVISDDLSNEVNGFALIGLIGINKKISHSSFDIVSKLERNGINVVFMSSSNINSAKQTLDGLQYNVISYKDLDCKDSPIPDVVCDFNDNIDNLLNKLNIEQNKTAIIGNYNSEQIKSLKFGSINDTKYENFNADIISDNKLSSIFKVFETSNKSAYSINKIIENYLCYMLIYFVPLFLLTVISGKPFIDAVSFLYLSYFVFPLCAISLLYYKDDMYLFKNKTDLSDPITKFNLLSVIVALILFVLYTIILKIFVTSDVLKGLIILSLFSFLPRGYVAKFKFNYSRTVRVLIQFIPVLITSFVFISPLSFVFGISGFNLFHAIISIVIGVFIRVLTHYISISVKN